jgi:hypothetical protein
LYSKEQLYYKSLKHLKIIQNMKYMLFSLNTIDKELSTLRGSNTILFFVREITRIIKMLKSCNLRIKLGIYKWSIKCTVVDDFIISELIDF